MQYTSVIENKNDNMLHIYKLLRIDLFINYKNKAILLTCASLIKSFRIYH